MAFGSELDDGTGDDDQDQDDNAKSLTVMSCAHSISAYKYDDLSYDRRGMCAINDNTCPSDLPSHRCPSDHTCSCLAGLTHARPIVHAVRTQAHRVAVGL